MIFVQNRCVLRLARTPPRPAMIKRNEIASA
jgi:hypothetical protein